MEMVQRGVAAVLVVSEVFESLAKAEVHAYGLSELPMIVLPHPLGNRSSKDAFDLGRGAVEQLLEWLRRE